MIESDCKYNEFLNPANALNTFGNFSNQTVASIPRLTCIFNVSFSLGTVKKGEILTYFEYLITIASSVAK